LTEGIGPAITDSVIPGTLRSADASNEAEGMKNFRLHTTADQDGVIHLDLPSQPNAEVDVEVVVRESGPRLHDPAANWDRHFFGTLLGDRVHSRQQRARGSANHQR
jgi:hypothetical protein